MATEIGVITVDPAAEAIETLRLLLKSTDEQIAFDAAREILNQFR